MNGLLTALDGSLDPARRDFQRKNGLLALHGAPNASMDAMPMAITLPGPQSGRMSPTYSQMACAWLGCSTPNGRRRPERRDGG